MNRAAIFLIVSVLLFSMSPSVQGQFCIDGETEVCGYGIGECRQGTRVCHDGEWGDCVGSLWPSQELCDDLDNDCDGAIDNDCVTQDMTWLIMVAGGIMLMVIAGLLSSKGKKRAPQSKWEKYK